MAQEDLGPTLFNLTRVTGQRRKDERTAMYYGMEINVRTRNLMLLGSPAILLVTAIFIPFIGPWCLLVTAAAGTAWYFLVVHRSNKGLQLPTYVAMFDKRKAGHGDHVQSGVTLTPTHTTPFRIVPGAVWNPRADEVTPIDAHAAYLASHPSPARKETRSASRTAPTNPQTRPGAWGDYEETQEKSW